MALESTKSDGRTSVSRLSPAAMVSNGKVAMASSSQSLLAAVVESREVLPIMVNRIKNAEARCSMNEAHYTSKLLTSRPFLT